MPTGLAALLLLAGIVGAMLSFLTAYKRKRAGIKYAPVMAAGIISCLMAALSACYLAAALLLLSSID